MSTWLSALLLARPLHTDHRTPKLWTLTSAWLVHTQLNVYPGLKGLKEMLGTVPSWIHYEERERVDVRPWLELIAESVHQQFAVVIVLEACQWQCDALGRHL